MKKRLFTLLLAALLVSSALTACGNSDAEKTNDTTSTNVADTTAAVETDALTDYEQRQLISDDLPENDFGGQEFRVLTTDHDSYNSVTFEIIAEELTGDACNDAVFNRNVDIGERFNMTIVGMAEKEPYKLVNNAVTAGTDEYDLAGVYNFQSYYLITAQSLLNWLEIPHVNLEKPWHNALSNDAATINGRLYTICSDYAITSMTYTYATFFNVRMLTDYGYPAENLYDMVRNGEWTIDKMSEMVAGMYTDTNGDGKKDADDIYGYGYELTNPADVWTTAFGEHLSSVTKDNDIEINFMTDKMVSILEKLMDFHYNNEGVYLPATQYDEEKYFLNGKFAMAPLRFHTAYTTLREMEDTYSMLPYPKWDEDQDTYYTNADDKFTAFGVPMTAYGNLEFVGTIYEALCAESYKKVYPAYYDIALKGKYSSDAGTAEMVDLIMAGRYFDFSFQFGETIFQNLPYQIRNMLRAKNTNLASTYDSMEKKLWTQIDEKLLPLYGIE